MVRLSLTTFRSQIVVRPIVRMTELPVYYPPSIFQSRIPLLRCLRDPFHSKQSFQIRKKRHYTHHTVPGSETLSRGRGRSCLSSLPLSHESHPTHNRFVRVRISNAATAVVGSAGRKIACLQSPNIVKSQKHIRCTAQAQYTPPIESVILVEAASTLMTLALQKMRQKVS